jgi:protein translocase SecG subunit
MSILITFLTLLLVLNCLILILLVLIQLPKKEAGAGLAFGGGATDALFGSGSGNALTKLTKTFAATFLVLSLGIGLMNAKAARTSTSDIRKQLAAQKLKQSSTPAAPVKPVSQFQTLSTTNSLAATPTAPMTNAAVKAATNAVATPTPPANTTTNAAAPK